MRQFCFLRPYLGIETASCRMLVPEGKDGYGWKLEKIGPTFSSFSAMTAKIAKKLLRFIVLPDKIYFVYFS